MSSTAVTEKLCAFCGAPRVRRDDRLLPTCSAQACADAAGRVAVAEVSSRGIPRVRRGRVPQPEALRTRKQWLVRVQPDLRDRIKRAAARERISVAEYVERWARTLPSTTDAGE